MSVKTKSNEELLQKINIGDSVIAFKKDSNKVSNTSDNGDLILGYLSYYDNNVIQISTLGGEIISINDQNIHKFTLDAIKQLKLDLPEELIEILLDDNEKPIAYVVDEYIIANDGQILRIKSIGEGTVTTYNNVTYNIDIIEPWFPTLGEYCIFWRANHQPTPTEYTVSKYKSGNKTQGYMTELYTVYDHVAPTQLINDLT